RLAQKLPTGGVQYPFEFHCVNDKAINAFALPGGYVFVNRGAIEASDNEAQLAGVMAHELSHVALRHGTNQATKAMVAETGLGIFGAIFGDSAGGALLTTLGNFTAGGVLLRYSRTAESQADVMGPQELYASGEDPRPPSRNFAEFRANSYSLKYPDNWKKYPDSDGAGVSFAPDGGVVSDGSGHSALAYGLIIRVSQAKGNPGDESALSSATNQVIQDLQKSNPSMKITRQGEHVRLNGQPGLSAYLSNASPAGGQETDWVVTVLRPDALVYFVCVAPQSAY